jgi:RNA polymerase sigma factor (sigma-70 family)
VLEPLAKYRFCGYTGMKIADICGRQNCMDINELYELLRGGDPEAKESLLRYLQESFCAFMHHKDIGEDDAKDIVQAALVRIADMCEIAEIHSSFGGWAHAVLKNELAGFYRKRSLVSRKMTELGERQKPVSHWSGDNRVKVKLEECLRDLHKRNKTYVRVLNLHYLGYTTGEICERLDMSTNNLHVVLSRARSALRKCLAKKGALHG